MRGSLHATSIHKDKLLNKRNNDLRLSMRRLRTPQEQLELLRSRPGKSQREVTRLEYSLWLLEEVN